MPWNQKSPPANGHPQMSKRKLLHYTQFALIGALGIAAVLFILFTKHTPSENEGEIKPIKAIGKIQDVTPQTNISQRISSEEKPRQDDRQLEIERFRAMTPDEKLDFLYERAKNMTYDPTPPKGRAFSSGIEQVMSWIFTTRLGDPPPPFPRMSIYDEVHLAEIILSDNPASQDDSEDIKYAKETVSLAKKELVKYIKEGGDIEGFLTYYRDQLSEAHHEYNSARRMVFEAYRTESDREVCDLYLQRMNAELAEKGIKEVVVPEKLIERFSKEMSTKGNE